MKKIFINFLILLLLITMIPLLDSLKSNTHLIIEYQYFIGVVAVAILVLSRFWDSSLLMFALLALIAYLGYFFINGNQWEINLVGADIFITLLIALIAAALGKNIHKQFLLEAASQTMEQNKGIYQYQQIQTIVESEFARAFRYKFSIVLIRLQGIPKQTNSSQTGPNLEAIDNLMADFLSKNLRMTDILVRLNGLNNFLIICPQIDQAEANLMLQRLSQRLKSSELVGYDHSMVSFPKDGHSFEELLHILDLQFKISH